MLISSYEDTQECRNACRFLVALMRELFPMVICSGLSFAPHVYDNALYGGACSIEYSSSWTSTESSELAVL